LFPTGRDPFNASPADVGRRVRVDYKPAAFGSEAETVRGVLFRWSGGTQDGILRLRDRNGVETGIRSQEVTEIRVLPPEVSAFDMERLAQQGWPSITTEPLGDWSLRHSCGYGDRANSVRIAGAPTNRSLKATLKAVEGWYADRGAEARLQIPIPFDAEPYEDLGWLARRQGRLMVNSVPRFLTTTAPARERIDLDLEVKPEPDKEWFSLVSGYTTEHTEEFAYIMAAVRPAAFIYCRNLEGKLLGIGRATLQDTWCGATTIDTLPQSRRRGIATAISARMAIWAAEQGAQDWYLQVFHDNAAARSFFENLGFTTHHKYEYRSKDPDFVV
jgi:GNAT superfamily N-acetyltransferase